MLGKLFGETVEIAGRYRLGEQIGRGGLGFVHRARDLKLDRDVALKFPKGASANPEIVADLEREAKVLARLQHPNIVAVYDVGQSEQGVYLAMELIDGVSMSEWLAEGERTWREVVDVMRAAGEGLAAAHEAGVVHRDFKPSNVMIDHAGRVRVVDFGLAREVGGVRPEELASESSSDSKTSAAGTPPYMAPEQFDGRVTAASDQFAFCTALYEGICGARPWSGRARGVCQKSPSAAAIDRELKRGGLPRQLRKVVVRGLDEQPDGRFETMAILIAQLGLRRGWIRMGIPVLAAATAAVMASVLLSNEPSPCDIVDSKARAVLEPAVADFEFPVGELEDDFEALLEDWERFERKTCRAAREQSIGTELLDARERCLDRRARQLAYALGELPPQPGADLVRGVLIRRMTFAQCADDAELLRQTSEKGFDADLQDRILMEASDASVLISLGREQEAFDMLATTHGRYKDSDGAAYGVAKLGLSYSVALSHRGRLDDARDVLFDALVTVSRAPQLSLVEAEVRAMLALQLSFSGKDSQEARRLAEVAKATLEGQSGHGFPLSMAELALARTAAMDGDEESVHRALARLRDIVARSESRAGTPWYDYERNRLELDVAAADALNLVGDRSGALVAYKAVLPRLREGSGLQRPLAVVLNNLGELESQQNPTELAAQRVEEAAALKRQLGDSLGAAQSWMTAGSVHLRGNRPEQGLKAYEVALAVLPSEAGGTRFEVLYNVGLAHQELGELAPALASFEEALQIPMSSAAVDPEVSFSTHVAAAQVALRMQKDGVAESHSRAAMKAERPDFSPYARAELKILECQLAPGTGGLAERLRREAIRLADAADSDSLRNQARGCARTR